MATIKMEMEIVWHTADEKPENDSKNYYISCEDDASYMPVFKWMYDESIDSFYWWDEQSEDFRKRSEVKYWAVVPEIPFPGA